MKLRLIVNPLGNRQLDERGVGLLWRACKSPGGGLVAFFRICDDPDCGARDVQVWAIPASRELRTVETDGRGGVVLESLAPQAPEPSTGWDVRKRRPPRPDPQLYALVDIDRWTVSVHPFYRLERRARPMLEQLRAEMDAELRDYLRRRYSAVRQMVGERQPSRGIGTPQHGTKPGSWLH